MNQGNAERSGTSIAHHRENIVSAVSLTLGVVALIVALIGVIVNPGAAGPAGPVGADGQQGPQGNEGPTGPPGTGSILATNVSRETTTIQTICTHYAKAEVTITVPSQGTIVVSTVVQIYIDHTYGTTDSWYVVHGLSAVDCGTWSQAAVGSVPANVDSEGFLRESVFVQTTFDVSAGTFTYYVNGYMISGQSANDWFWFSNSVAVFYPS